MASYKKLGSKCNDLVYKSTIANCCFRAFSPSREGKSPGNKVEATQTQTQFLELLPCPHDTLSKGKNMSFTRKMFRILTCLFFKKRGLFSVLVQNSPKVTKKVLVFRKVARSCSLTKKLLKILKVAKKLPSRIWKGLTPIQGTRARDTRFGPGEMFT